MNFEDIIRYDILLTRMGQRTNTIHREFKIDCDRYQFQTWVEQHFGNFLHAGVGRESGMIIDIQNKNVILYSGYSRHVKLEIAGSEEFIQWYL